MFPPSQALRFRLDVDADVTFFTGAGVLFGWSLTNESDTTAAQVEIYDGPENNDHSLAVVNLSASESTRDLWAPSGVELRAGLAVVVSGAMVIGTLFALPAEIVDAFLLTQGMSPIWSGGG